MDNVELLKIMLNLALTTCALCLPSISIAYIVLNNVSGEQRRMSRVIVSSSMSAIILLTCSILIFCAMWLGYETEKILIQISGILFILVCMIIFYVLLVLAGFRWMIPTPPTQETQ